MIVKCETCGAGFDDEFRSTICPHNTFLANNGRNEFKEHVLSYLSTNPNTDYFYEDTGDD